MTAVYKEPGKAPEIIDAGNSLTALQHLVRGYLEAVTVCSDVVLLCNEEGRLRGMPHNLTFLGLDLVGPVLLVGADGEEFADLPEAEFWRGKMEMREGEDGDEGD